MMPYSDPRDRSVYFYQIIFLVHLFVPTLLFIKQFTLKHAVCTPAILILTSFSDVLVTFVSDQVM